jgi:predicted  nucleic acid-binding Zn-ribbon protein
MSSEDILDWTKLNTEWEKLEKRVLHLERLLRTVNDEKSDPDVKKKLLQTQQLTHEWIAEFSKEIIFRVREMINEVNDQMKKYDGQIAHLEEQMELLRIELNRTLGLGQKRKQHGRPLI